MSNKIIKCSAILLIGLGVLFFANSSIYVIEQKKIATALNLIKQNKRTEAMELVETNTKKNGVALFLKGNLLMQSKRYNEALDVFLETTQYLSTPELYQQLGMAYSLVNQQNKAIESYNKAKNLQPNRFTPTYFLMKTYQHKGDTTNTIIAAKEIVNMKIKVPSSKIDFFIKEANTILNKYKN